jgi:hypothetical protein
LIGLTKFNLAKRIPVASALLLTEATITDKPGRQEKEKPPME